MLKLLADENIGGDMVAWLRAQGCEGGRFIVITEKKVRVRALNPDDPKPGP
jgi:hypothetical protein